MYRMLGSTFASRFLITSLATFSLSLAIAGCGSSGTNEPADAGADTGSTTCDLAGANAVFTAKGCAATGCHDSTGSAAGLDMASAGLAARLVGKAPPGGGTTFQSMCNNMNKIYLVAGSNPATGLFLDKLSASPGCGVQMPFLAPALTATQMACVQSWANTVTKP